MKTRQGSALLLIFFLSSYSLSTDIRGGYSKQRLGLLFMTALESHYAADPLSLYIRDLPIEVVDHDSRPNMIAPLLKILEQEHWLSSSLSTAVITLGETAQVQTQVITYFVTDDSDFVDVELGDLRIESITEMVAIQPLNEQAVTQQYDVQFLWSLNSEVEWIWASQLDTFKTIQILRAATSSQQRGKARFVFSNNHWRLASQPSVYGVTSID